jgi:hypothetical protein
MSRQGNTIGPDRGIASAPHLMWQFCEAIGGLTGDDSL